MRCYPITVLLYLVSAALLAGCGHQVKQQPATSPVAAADTSRALPATPAPPATAPALAAIQPAVAQLIDSREVSPGLVVTTTGIPVSEEATASPRRILTIRRRGQLIYADTTTDFLYRDPAEAEMQLYPLWVPAGPDRGELLVRVATPPDLDFVRRFVVAGRRVTCRDTLPAFDEPARNLDQDPALELSGYRYSGEQWEEGGQQWTTYNPRLYYEVRPTGLVLDSALTRQKALTQYGVFRGFRYADKPGTLLKEQAQQLER